jgi:putative transposase
MTLPQAPDLRRSLDFVSDVLAGGRRFRVLVVVDHFTRERLALAVDTSVSDGRVVRALDDIIGRRCRPAMIVRDNGIEPTSHAVLQRRAGAGVEWHDLAPGIPARSAFEERLNERRNEHMFRGLPEARWIIGRAAGR